MTTGAKIADIRKKNNMSQEAFGYIFNVSRQAICKWEANTVLPETENIIKICNEFNISINWLLGIGDEEFNDEKEVETLAIVTKVNHSYNEKFDRLFGKSNSTFKTATVLMSILIVVMAFLYISLYNSNINVNENLVDMESEITRENFELKSEINELQSNYDKLLSEMGYQNGQYEFSVDFVDYEKEIVTMSFEVMPKMFQSNTTAKIEVINIESREIFSVELDKNLDNFYNGEIEIPFWKDVQIRVGFTTNSITEFEIIKSKYDLENIHTPQPITQKINSVKVSDRVHESVEIMLQYYDVRHKDNLEIKNLSLYYLSNGKQVEQSDAPDNYIYDCYLSGGNDCYLSGGNSLYITIPKIVVPESSYSYEMFIKFEDNVGNVYEQSLATYDFFEKNWVFASDFRRTM